MLPYASEIGTPREGNYLFKEMVILFSLYQFQNWRLLLGAHKGRPILAGYGLLKELVAEFLNLDCLLLMLEWGNAKLCISPSTNE
jgi:hypothetical protein